jgi:site-specific recombinase XerD
MTISESQNTYIIRADAHTSIVRKDYLSSDQHPVVAYLASLKPSGRRTQEYALNVIAQLLIGKGATWRDIAWHHLTVVHTTALRSMLEASDYAPATCNKTLSGLRSVLRFAWRLGYMQAETYHRAVDVRDIKGSRLPAGRHIETGEIEALMAYLDENPSVATIRDAAIVAVLYQTGLRRSELVALSIEHYNVGTGAITVTGKGNRERLIYVAANGKRRLDRWLKERGRGYGALFLRVHYQPGNKQFCILKDQRESLSTHAIYNMLRRRAASVGLPDFSPHDFRRTFVGNQLDAGTDLPTVADMAGHADTRTTARYDRRGERRKIEAAHLINVP